MQLQFISIGIIRTEFELKTGVPIQAAFGYERIGKIEIDKAYQDGLQDLNEFSHIHLLYHLDRHSDYALITRPYMDETQRGVFATRAPKRPNPIGMAIVELVSIHENIITFKGVDMLNNTPLIDIKPYVGEIDSVLNPKCGWYDKVLNKARLSDDRF